MLFELDIGPLSLERTRGKELEQQVERLIDDYRRTHPGLSEDEIQQAMRLVLMQSGAEVDPGQADTPVLDSVESLRGRLIGFFVLLVMIVAGAFLFFLVRRP